MKPMQRGVRLQIQRVQISVIELWMISFRLFNLICLLCSLVGTFVLNFLVLYYIMVIGGLVDGAI